MCSKMCLHLKSGFAYFAREWSHLVVQHRSVAFKIGSSPESRLTLRALVWTLLLMYSPNVVCLLSSV